MIVFRTYDEVSARVGQELGTSSWWQVDQARVDAFADCTGDHQWIHVDVARSGAGPFGGTIAHGFLTLSLIPVMQAEVFSFETPGPRLNYGANKIRFPAPLLVGRRIRDTCTLIEVTELSSGRQVVVRHVVEIEGENKPACVADVVALLIDG
ncbi:MAG: MaoC family dehydratase [Marmoricola sp.]|jgi:acyl dehydratase|nr:MaoC family dehydratase [Marmoricola sp.]